MGQEGAAIQSALAERMNKSRVTVPQVGLHEAASSAMKLILLRTRSSSMASLWEGAVICRMLKPMAN